MNIPPPGPGDRLGQMAPAPQFVNDYRANLPNPPRPQGPLYGVGTSDPGFQENTEYGWDDGDDGAHTELVEGDGDGDVNGRDAKRRRIARACDMCRKKKIKCDGKEPKCSHCQNYKTECIFTQVEKKRNPPKGAKYIESLENRLGRMESLLRLSGLLTEDDGGRTDLGTLEKRLAERSSSGPRSNVASPQSQTSPIAQATARMGASAAGTPHESNHVQAESPPNRITSPEGAQSGQQQQQQQQQRPYQQATQNQSQSQSQNQTRTPAQAQGQGRGQDQKRSEHVDALADQMCSLITNNSGETRYIGSSSGFSIFSPKGIQWVNQKTGDDSFQKMIASASDDDEKFDHWKPEVFTDLFARRVFKPLPSKQEAYSLLRDYFTNFNCMFPLFHEPTFMHLVDKQYNSEPYEGSGWWASLNVVFAIAHRLRVMSNVVSREEDEHAWGYLKNAMAVMTELTMRNTDLLSVQALLGMAMFLQGTPNPQPSFFLVAAAVRLAHSIGLHKRGSGFNLNEVENEQRKRVFWIAYIQDKDICLRSGRPPAQDDDDLNVELPSEDPPDNIGNIPLEGSLDDKGQRKTMNLFRLMCTFAEIQSQVYKRLYSVKASRQSDGELLNTIGELDQALEEWKDGIPIAFRPEHEIKASHTPLILHVVVLHFAYYNCLTTIHRMSVHHGYWTSRLSNYAIQGLNARPLNPRVFMSASLCVNAARTSISLIRYIPQGDYACVWLIIYYPVSALVTLFANILQNPQDARARSDLKLMSSVVAFLRMIVNDATESNSSVGRMLSVCSEFERIARVVLDKAERDLKGRAGSKRKAADKLERERAKAQQWGNGIRDIDGDLKQGKTLEQLQIETQSAYRRPVQTPSMRASQASSNNGNSPHSWGGSQQADHRTPEVKNDLPAPQYGGANLQSTSGQWEAQPAAYPIHNGHGGYPGDQNQQYPPFPQPQQSLQQDGFHGNASFTPPNLPDPLSDFNMQNFASQDFNAADGSSGAFGTNNGFSGSFQQPFVPQDLWQMPMTLEWDWAEGLGMGSLTPQPFLDANGGFMDSNGPPQRRNAQ
ncbi:hypothetical protein MBLNU230_g0165t1 [Neophaeotheca triangularis]